MTNWVPSQTRTEGNDTDQEIGQGGWRSASDNRQMAYAKGRMASHKAARTAGRPMHHGERNCPSGPPPSTCTAEATSIGLRCNTKPRPQPHLSHKHRGQHEQGPHRRCPKLPDQRRTLDSEAGARSTAGDLWDRGGTHHWLSKWRVGVLLWCLRQRPLQKNP